MKKFPSVLCLGVLSLALLSLQPVMAADYQYNAVDGTANNWENNNASRWNANPPWDGRPVNGVGPTASDNLNLAGAVPLFLSNNGSDGSGGYLLKNYGINELSVDSDAGTPQELRGSSQTRAALTASSIILSASGNYLSIYRGQSSTVLGVDTGSLSIAAGATFYAGHATNNAGSINRFVVSGTTVVNGQLSNSVRNSSAIAEQINFGDLVVNSGGSVGLGDSESATPPNNPVTLVEARSLAGEGFVYGSNIEVAGNRTSNLNIETAASSNAVFSGSFANSSVSSAGTNLLNVTVSGSGRQTFTGGASTYTGTTSIQNATLAVAVLANGGSASSIGASGTSAANLVIDGGTLEYIGNTASTNRLFTVGANGATLNASGAGTITYSATNAVTYSAAGNNTLGFSGSGSGVFAGRINNEASGVTGVSKSGIGTWVLSGSHGYTGTTNVTGGKLIVDGFINASSGVNVGEGATLGGHGQVSRISGAGTVAAGNSPGILTATDVDASGGLDFAFEFTTQAMEGVSLPTFGSAASSGNDVLRLTDATPFEFSLTSSNTISVDFSGITLADGDRYLGGFYADSGDFWSQIENAQFVYSGINGFAITVSTVQQNANFGSGAVGGYVTEFTVHAIPEPSSIALFGLSLVGFGTLLRRRSIRSL